VKAASLWLEGNFDSETKREVERVIREEPESLDDRFAHPLRFGTAGMRGLMGVGPNRMNVYTVRAATQGLANFLGGAGSVVIGYDSRHHSREFAEQAAGVLIANGIEVFLFDEIRPVPLLSFAVRHLTASAGILITASHNPSAYNGYKVYGSYGGQVVSPDDQRIIEEVEKIEHLDQIEVAPLNSPLLHWIGEEIDDAYLAATDKMRSIDGSDELKVVYTPLHGSGITIVPKALERWGYTSVTLVEAQAEPDGAFPTVKVPNPEEDEALALGIETMERVGGDLLLATDPDSDRVGIALADGSRLNGNEIAAICLDWLAKQQFEEPVGVAKSIVTSELFRAIAERRGWQCEDLLTGFKYFGQLIERWNSEESFHFLFGAEESYGYLLGQHARDKDGVIACQLLCEIALDAKRSGYTLRDRLHQIYKRHGIYQEKVVALSLSGDDPMIPLRANLPTHFAGKRVVRVEDYQPAADVLLFHLEGGEKLVARPSGTEPKIKLYCGARSAYSEPVEEAIALCDQRADQLLSALRAEMNL